MTVPLAGLLVADFSRILAGPLCTMMLADAGARVVKIEEPRGDETRRWGPPFAGGESAYFLSVNRNKESVVLDLRTGEGLEAAKRLAARADVVVENFKAEDRARFALDAKSVHATNPRAIVCSITGFERETPEEGLPGYDLLAQAAGGIMAITGEPDGPPVKVGVAMADVLTAHFAHGAILAALYARERTGRGEVIEVSLVGATVASLVNVAQSYLLTGDEPGRYGSAHPSIVPYQAFRASDRAFVLAIATDRHFDRFAREVLGRADLADDPRFATNAARVAHRGVLIPEIERALAAAPAERWIDACRERGIPATLVERFGEIFARGFTETVEHPSIGPLTMVRPPAHFGAAPRAFEAPPRLGEHTASVLAELGLGQGTKSGSGA